MVNLREEVCSAEEQWPRMEQSLPRAAAELVRLPQQQRRPRAARDAVAPDRRSERRSGGPRVSEAMGHPRVRGVGAVEVVGDTPPTVGEATEEWHQRRRDLCKACGAREPVLHLQVDIQMEVRTPWRAVAGAGPGVGWMA